MLGQFVDARQHRALVNLGRACVAPSLDLDARSIRERYNREPFELTHRLHADPMFGLESLTRLVRRLPASHVVCRRGHVPDDADFDASFEPLAPPTLDEAIDGLSGGGMYVYARNPEHDPEYRPLIEALLAEVAAVLSADDGPITWYSTYLFVSSSGSVTPYHMDREMNFLLQIRGTKSVRLWDPDDPRVLSERDRERLLSYDGARPAYRPEIADLARTFVLGPGIGVHHPFIAPHLVKTEGDLSVSLALTFRTLASDRITRAYQFNHRLRRAGFAPGPVGHRVLVDRVKADLLRSAVRARDAVRRLRGPMEHGLPERA